MERPIHPSFWHIKPTGRELVQITVKCHMCLQFISGHKAHVNWLIRIWQCLCGLTPICPLKKCNWQYIVPCIKPWTNTNLSFPFGLNVLGQHFIWEMCLQEPRSFLSLQSGQPRDCVLKLREAVLHVLFPRFLLVQIILEKVHHFLYPRASCQDK